MSPTSCFYSTQLCCGCPRCEYKRAIRTLDPASPGREKPGSCHPPDDRYGFILYSRRERVAKLPFASDVILRLPAEEDVGNRTLYHGCDPCLPRRAFIPLSEPRVATSLFYYTSLVLEGVNSHVSHSRNDSFSVSVGTGLKCHLALHAGQNIHICTPSSNTCVRSCSVDSFLQHRHILRCDRKVIGFICFTRCLLGNDDRQNGTPRLPAVRGSETNLFSKRLLHFRDDLL